MSDILIEIRVRPGSSRNKVGGFVGEPPRLVVAVQAPAVDGKANAALLKELAAAFRDLGVRARDLTIVHGELSRDKRVLLSPDSPSQSAAISARLAELIGVLP
jgi:uncharacterized protein (TIGR00251 family)